ncbi:MAG: restriction endonuclease [Spirochaetaceae bacterium]|nr:restriction endonuclease [Spirochaetaceae bacterium]
MEQERISIARKGEMIKAVLLELKAAGGRARVRQLINAAELKLNLTAYERAPLEKSGYVRWHTIIHFYSIDCAKAGYLTKSGGYWTLTEEGRKALDQGAEKFIRSAMTEYRKWKRERDESEPDTEEESDESVRQTAYEQAVDQAAAEIEAQIQELEAYDFQKLVAELLRAMGYHVPHVAPPGPDGGIDLVAYKDPLGSSEPRIRAQVKHRNQKVAVAEVRALEAVLRKDGDMGLFVSSGGFTADAIKEVRSSTKHIETMDLERLILLWQQHYDNVRESGKALLPLVRVYFLSPPEE